MREPVENESLEEAKAIDPYGEVALGVECAWPQSIPAFDETQTEPRS